MSVDEFVDEFGEIETIEDKLRESLRHVPAPAGFADQVMARVAERETRARRPVPRSMLASIRLYGAWWAGIAAALMVTVGGGDALFVRHQRQAREAAAVQAQMDVAMQLTNHALNEIQIGLDRSPAGKFAQLWNGTEK
jgi:anti-sigma factor RsiW